jgi:type I restriction enzyme M protein
MNASTLVQKLWNYCNVLRDDGMSYGDYVEQLTFLLFLKMADERSRPPYSQPSIIPGRSVQRCQPPRPPGHVE